MLTKRQNQIYEFINEYSKKYKISPTHKEIANKFKLSSVATVHEHLSALKNKGYIKKEHGQNRAIQIDRAEKDSLIHLPIIGTIAAGQPIEAIEDGYETIALVNSQVKNSRDHYALRVAGDSMIEEGIFDGDIVVIKKQSVAENGQTVVAIIDEDKATLKKIYKEKGKFRLQPRNQNMLPFFRRDVEIRGVVVQVIRNMDTIDKQRPAQKEKNGLKMIDLFAGIGGIRMGFENLGCECVFSSEWDESAKKTYFANFKEIPHGDITKIKPEDIPSFDILLAGFPCQPFSQAGKKQGLADARGTLFFDIAKIIDYHRPRVVFLENVKRFLTHDNKQTFAVLESILKGMGYTVHAKVLNAKDFGLPQNRERIYIVGFLGKTNFEFPKPTNTATKLDDILEKSVNNKYTISDKLWAGHQRRKKEHREKGNGFGYSLFNNNSKYTSTISARYYKDGSEILVEQKDKNPRKLTPREAARLQGFPDYFVLPVSDNQAYKQFGNSVAVPVIESVAKEVIKSLPNLNKRENRKLKKIDLEKIKKESIEKSNKPLAEFI